MSMSSIYIFNSDSNASELLENIGTVDECRSCAHEQKLTLIMISIFYYICIIYALVCCIIHNYDLVFFIYADNTQLKYSFTNKLSDIESCVSEIKLCMERNMLKLNDDKT